MKPKSTIAPDPSRRLSALAHRLGAALAVLAAGGVLVLLNSDLARTIDYQALIHATRRMPLVAVGWALVATAASFAAVIARDASGLQYIAARVPWRAVAVAAFCGTSLGNVVGFGSLTGGAVRSRIYGALGVKPAAIARLILFIAGSFGIGLAGFASVTALAEAGPVAHFLGWSPPLLRIVAALVLGATLLILRFGLRGTIRIGSFELAAPPRRLVAIQLLLTGVRLTGAAAALWVLMPPLPETAPIDFLSFAAIFAVATALGVASNVPGGLGVFEAVVIAAFGGRVAPDRIAAALLAFRGIYFLLPLVISAVLLAAFEIRLAARGGNVPGDPVGRTAARLSPVFLGVMTFAAGVMLVVSGATPVFGSRLAILAVRLPLWFVESSNFFGSLVGVVFLFVARGLFNRRDGAWWLALGLAIASLGLSLAKGLAYSEAGFLTILVFLLLATRRQFNMPASMLGQPFAFGWFVAIAVILAASIGLLLFAFQDVSFSRRDLWWQFEFDAQAPRALRAIVGASVLGAGIALWQLLRPPRGYAELPDPTELARAATIIRTQSRSDALLAMMADKSMIFSANDRAFLMFGQRGRSWIALFDPVGPREEWPALIGRLVELAHAHGGRAAFYQVRPESLPFYLDAGLSVMKLGEEARVDLAAFNLQGSRGANLRYAVKRGERDGLSFELLDCAPSAAAIAELEGISNDWLGLRRRRGGTAERGFSVAVFDPAYVAAQQVAVVRQNGAAVAFATVMHTALHDEASIGLMRHRRMASPYAMEYLFTQLLLAFKDLGYRAFSLGMAPLAGVERGPLSSRWHWIGALIWRHGNPIYNFQGLRVFKGKFHPAWEPRYLAASGTLGPFVALLDVAGLIAARYKRSRRPTALSPAPAAASAPELAKAAADHA
jgi:phosphatidylglycerol lysyltransferase